MPKNATYFENEDDEPRNKNHSPSPNEWFGVGRSKFRTKSPTFSEELPENDKSSNWRDWFHGHIRDPLWNPLLPAEKKHEAIKFRDMDNDPRGLIYVLENSAEVFEAMGHIDLAAECENICEIICSEE